MKLYYLPLLFLGCNPASEKTIKNQSDTVQATIASKVVVLKSIEKLENDTLKYLKDNFVTNKAAFINRPFKTVLDKLELPVIRYTPAFADFPDTTTIPGIYLKFEKDVTWLNKIDSKKTPNALFFRFKRPLNLADAIKITKKDKAFWGNEAAKFYGEAIIENISLIGDRQQ